MSVTVFDLSSYIVVALGVFQDVVNGEEGAFSWMLDMLD